LERLRALVRAQGVSGQEEPVRRAIRDRLPPGSKVEVDNLGNLTVAIGSGRPLRLILAPLDEPGYVVSRIQDDGYLRVQRLARLPLPPLFDQFHVGQPMAIGSGEGGEPLPAASAVLSTHLRRGRRPDPGPVLPPVAEDLLLDVGARSHAEAGAFGVRLLAPVTREKDLSRLAGGRVAGPSLEGRLGCAALVDLAARLEPERIRGGVILAFAAQSWVGFRGAARLATRFEPDEVLVVDSYAPDPPTRPARAPAGAPGLGPILARAAGDSGLSAPLEERIRRAARVSRLRIQRAPAGALHDGTAFEKAEVALLGAPVRFPHTPSEMADLADLESLTRLLEAYLEEVP
jgi:putative aminopeptidase FrvX